MLSRWPSESAAQVFSLQNGHLEIVAEEGDIGVLRPWASVSKLAVALGIAFEVDQSHCSYEEVVKSETGATLAQLVSHCSGLGFEAGDPTNPPGTRRVYSNIGIDTACEFVRTGRAPGQWLQEVVFEPLEMSASLDGRAAAGVTGSVKDMTKLAVAWLTPQLISAALRDRAISVYEPELNGIVPGFGRFSPCPWGLGPEIRGHKQHWMGDWPAESFGHFGQSGTLVLMNVERQVGVVAAAGEPFGPWAVELWPAWTSEIWQAFGTL